MSGASRTRKRCKKARPANTITSVSWFSCIGPTDDGIVLVTSSSGSVCCPADDMEARMEDGCWCKCCDIRFSCSFLRTILHLWYDRYLQKVAFDNLLSSIHSICGPTGSIQLPRARREMASKCQRSRARSGQLQCVVGRQTWTLARRGKIGMPVYCHEPGACATSFQICSDPSALCSTCCHKPGLRAAQRLS